MVEDYVTGVVLHEIGHTLGLRHNFKGSLVPPSSSIMEYIDDFDQVNVFTPQSYDVAAVKLLYGISTDAPADPFCNDSGREYDPECATFDVGADPLTEWWQPAYEYVAGNYVTGAWNFIPSNFYLNSLLAFVRAGATGAVRQQAHDIVYALADGSAPAGGRPRRQPGGRLVGLSQPADLDRPGLRPVQRRQRDRERSLRRAREQPRVAVPGPAGRVPPQDERLHLLREPAHGGGRPEEGADHERLHSERSTGGPTPGRPSRWARRRIPLTADLLARIDVAVTPYFK